MLTITDTEAQTQLSTLLDRVAGGEEIIITKQGQPVARLIASNAETFEEKNKRIEFIEKLKKIRNGKYIGYGEETWKTMRDEGRR
jgi:prevent-host-death family protein